VNAIPSDETAPGAALEQLISDQALSVNLKAAVVACLTGRESRRWKLAELLERLNNLGVLCSQPTLIAALTELELEFSLCAWFPWRLLERGTEWSLTHKTELLELFSQVRTLPSQGAEKLSDMHKAVLLVVIAHRRKGGVSKTRIGEILRLDASPYLDELCEMELVYVAPRNEINWWRPTPAALVVLGLRSHTDIPELKELEQWFDAQKSFWTSSRGKLDPIVARAAKTAGRRRIREAERRASVPSEDPPQES